MENSTLLELMVDQLRDVYDAEKQLTKALPKLAKAANDEELAGGFREHLAQTQEQVQRIEQIFEQLGMKARSKPCMAMKGLIEEGKEVMEDDLEDSMMDIALCAAARRVEHYEMAAYDSLMAVAKAARQPEVADLLKQTLAEETDTDKKLSTVAKRLLKEATSGSGASTSDEEKKPSRPARGKSSGSGKASGRSGNGGHLSTTTTDPEEIRQWAEERGGKPACVQGTGGKGDIGVLRLEFPGKPGANDDKLTPISWEDFFSKFEERGLALVYQEKTAAGQKSNFNKLIARETGGKAKTKAAR